MSSHGGRRQRPGPGPRPAPEPAGPSPVGLAQLGWALLVIAAALIGGLAAATLVHTSITTAVIVSVVAGGLAVLATFRSPARPPELRAGQPAEEDFGQYPGSDPRTPLRRPSAPSAQALRSVPPASFAPPAADPTAPLPAEPDGQARGGPPAGNQTVVQLLPLPPQPGNAEPPDAPWWDSAQGAPAPSPGAKRAPAPDLSTYLASTFIAQCPRCGAFRLDLRRSRNGWDFRCEACECTWNWQPGTPWPPVRVMPRGRPPAP
jgi:hypothetical protein